eukprot:gene6401-7425_t
MTKSNINSLSGCQSLYPTIFSPLEASHLHNSSNYPPIGQLKSAAWNVLGNDDLATYFSELSLNFDNRAAISSLTSLPAQPRLDLVSHAQLALLATHRGDFEKASSIIDSSTTQVPFVEGTRSPMAYVSLVIDFDRSMARGDLAHCETLAETMLAQLNCRSADDSGWRQLLETFERIARLYLMRGMITCSRTQ